VQYPTPTGNQVKKRKLEDQSVTTAEALREERVRVPEVLMPDFAAGICLGAAFFPLYLNYEVLSCKLK
jgi:hypothetical protein